MKATCKRCNRPLNIDPEAVVYCTPCLTTANSKVAIDANVLPLIEHPLSAANATARAADLLGDLEAFLRDCLVTGSLDSENPISPNGADDPRTLRELLVETRWVLDNLG